MFYLLEASNKQMQVYCFILAVGWKRALWIGYVEFPVQPSWSTKGTTTGFQGFWQILGKYLFGATFDFND